MTEGEFDLRITPSLDSVSGMEKSCGLQFAAVSGTN
jgi:hypothetical protein